MLNTAEIRNALERSQTNPSGEWRLFYSENGIQQCWQSRDLQPLWQIFEGAVELQKTECPWEWMAIAAVSTGPFGEIQSSFRKMEGGMVIDGLQALRAAVEQERRNQADKNRLAQVPYEQKDIVIGW